MGYTSLGTPDNTVPNKALQRSDGTFRRASELKDWSLERAGRVKKGKTLPENRLTAGLISAHHPCLSSLQFYVKNFSLPSLLQGVIDVMTFGASLTISGKIFPSFIKEKRMP